MRIMENWIIQTLLITVAAQSAWSLLNDQNTQRAPSAAQTLGSLYRSAATKVLPERDGNAGLVANRGARCLKCGTGGSASYYGGDRNRYYPDSGANYGRGYDDNRNWYYQPDRMYGGADRYDDRYYNNRYDDYSRTSGYGSGGYGTGGYGAGGYGSAYGNSAYAGNSYYDPMTSSYRGNGYDNRDPYYYDQMRGYRDRSYGGGYDDRYNSGGNYRNFDYKNYRPYDETYRGTAGFDQAGRGYYFANQLPRPDTAAQKPPTSQSQHNSYNSQDSGIQPEYYNGKPSHSQTVSTNVIGFGAPPSSQNGGKQEVNSNKESDKDKDSAPYGFRPQSLGTSYLYDRTNNEEAGPATDAATTVQRDQDSNNKMDSANMMKNAN